MKVIKAMKKLKFWSRKKKKKKNYYFLTESPPPPSRPPPPPPPPPPPSYLYYPAHDQYEPLLPSAPPLPPWLEYDDMQFQEMFATADDQSNSASASLDDNSISKMPDIYICRSELEFQAADTTTCYQQQRRHMVVSNNVDSQLKKFERGSRVGAFGCVVSFGAHLVRCVFPCFHIPEREEETKLK